MGNLVFLVDTEDDKLVIYDRVNMMTLPIMVFTKESEMCHNGLEANFVKSTDLENSVYNIKQTLQSLVNMETLQLHYDNLLSMWGKAIYKHVEVDYIVSKIGESNDLKSNGKVL